MRAATYFSRRAVRPRACASTRAFTWRTTTAHRRSPQSGASRHDRSPWIVAEHSAPEPWTLALLTLGLVALFVARASMSPPRADQYSCELLEEARSRRRADIRSDSGKRAIRSLGSSKRPDFWTQMTLSHGLDDLHESQRRHDTLGRRRQIASQLPPAWHSLRSATANRFRITVQPSARPPLLRGVACAPLQSNGRGAIVPHP